MVEESLPYQEVFTTVVPEQGLIATATSCFHVCMLQLLILLATDEFNYQSDKFNRKVTNSIVKVTNSIAKTCMIMIIKCNIYIMNHSSGS